jgi:hypothetical protein
MKENSIRLALAGFLLLFLQSCAWWPKSRTNALVGNWTNPVGTVWAIKGDGTFDVDVTRNGQPNAWGKYTVHGSTVVLVVTGGWRPKGCDQPGTYNFRRNGDELHFTVVSDACRLRRENLLLPWRLKK